MTDMQTNETKARAFPWPCANCCKIAVVPAAIDYTTKVKHDGFMHELRLVKVEIPRCQNCGELVITDGVDERINNALRDRLCLLTPTQMRAAIEKLGLKQQELAERLGVAVETISRWLDGGLIQSRAMDDLLRLYFALPEARSALQGSSQNPQLGIEVVTTV